MMQTHTNTRRLLSLIMVLAMVLTMLPASVFSAEDTITLYFRNDWFWTDVRAYAWGSNSSPVLAGWPGEAMTFVENDGTYDIYSIEVPASATGIIFNGIKDDGSGTRDQSPDITGFADGNAYYMHWNNGNLCSTFDYTPPTPGGDVGDIPAGEDCTVTLHFGNTVGWDKVNLYTWIPGGNTLSGNWPGSQLIQSDNGFYSYTFTVSSGSKVNFIYSNGSGSQTVDLNLGTVSSNVEKWIQLTSQDTEGKYYASQLTSAYVIALSPQVNGNSVTFEYVGNASTVHVAGTFNSWSGTANAMTYDSASGKWHLTLNNLAAGQHEYKFVINGTDWIVDPVNGWKISDASGNQNSAFFIADPNVKDLNAIDVNITYVRTDNNYTNWNVYAWGADGLENPYNLNANHSTTIHIPNGRNDLSVIFKVRKSVDGNDWAQQSGEVYVNLSKVVSGTVNVTVYCDANGNHTYSQSLASDVVMANKLASVELDYDTNAINITSVQAIANAANALKLVKNGQEIPCTVSSNGNVYTLTPTNVTLDLVNLYQYEILFEEHTYKIGINTIYASDKFAAEFTYNGKDLGANWSKDSTTFILWAPTASAVSVALYPTGNDSEATATHKMIAGEDGVWYVTVSGDLNRVYYTYLVERDGITVEAVDPYARTTGVNGQRGMVIDLDSTDPDGWENDSNPNPSTSYTDAIIYELHVRDFSIDDSFGAPVQFEDYMGKFLAFTLEGTTVPGTDISTGIDYLKSLGVTHIHLLPIYDYGSVDETLCNNFNWGYDPVNYNVPEGSYSTDPYKGELRVSEMKQMIQALHDAGISVIMDVVYNHVYDSGKFCFNQIVPGYFSRPNSNTSGCGNDTASEREMVSKYIIESVTYWCEEYHIDGFRFDLVGLIDVNTINGIIDSVHNGLGREDVIFYGEGWDMDSTNKEDGTEMAKQGNASKTPGFGYFSDSIRNLLAGENGKTTGFVSGSAGREAEIVANFRGNPWWTNNPSQVIQYASCHDNYTLIDKLIISTGANGITGDIISMNNLAAAIYMTSQGIPFIHAGEEMLREKLEEGGGRCENSYNASDYVNKIRWDKLEDSDYADTVAYYQGLIAFRNVHPALRYDTAALVSKYVKNTYAAGNVVAFHIDGYGAGDSDDIYIIFNANSTSTTVSLPEGTWTININKNDAGTSSLGTASGTVTVDSISAMVLTKADEGENKADPTITLYFTNSQNWESVYAYAWDANGTYLVGAWPGSTMTWVETNDYGQNVYSITLPTTAQNIIFNNGSGTQTVDLSVGVDGTGYYCDTANNEGKWTCGTYTYREPYGDPDDFYLFGYINGGNYACEENGNSLGDYLFEDGTLTVTFQYDSYVGVKTGDNATWYMTNGWLGNVTSATLYDSTTMGEACNKLMVPGGVEVTFTLVDNGNGTLSLRYEADYSGAYKDETGIQDGVTLHCWNWSFQEIERNMALIAEMGFTAIQTSPVQPLKEATAGFGAATNWWVYYQPIDFVITDGEGNALGNKEDLERMIATAHRYGIKVIVDVVANHLANQTGNDLSNKIPAELTGSDFWHDISKNTTDYTNRYEVTQYCMAGLPDLNTGNDSVQAAVLAFLKECVDIGVDGFRFDAAKHIETPDDDASCASDFWPTVLGRTASYAESKQQTVYFYGEVLDSIDHLPVSAYTKYMSVTDNSWGNTLRENISAGNAILSAGFDKAAQASNLVIWAESHDTFANDDGASKDETIAKINLTWALVAARADAMGLYLARPENGQLLGASSTQGWYSPEVAAVNKFHNAFVGQSETVGSSGDIAYVVRSNSGIVLVNAKGGSAAVNISVPMADGIYKDQISGNTFTVASGRITGTIGSTGIAVIYSVAEINGQSFGSLQEALSAAVEGDTVKLLSNTSIQAVELLKGIELDLNGYTLTVTSHVAAFDGNAIIDSTGGGLLKIEKSYLMLQADNGYLPIWNGVDGYTFADCAKLNQLTTNTSDDSLVYAFLPAIGTASYELLAAGADISGVTMKVVVSWEKAGGTTGSITFTYADSLLEEFFNSYDSETGIFTQTFKLTLSGIAGKALTFQVYFESDTGVLLECGN